MDILRACRVKKRVLYENRLSHQTTWEIFIPFEGCGFGGCYDQLLWKYYDGKFVASPFELTFSDPMFYFMCKTKSKEKKIINLKRKHAGKFYIDEIVPVYHHVGGYQIQLQANNLDINDYYTPPSPYLILKDTRGNMIYTTEIHVYDKNPCWQPFALPLVPLGGPDAVLNIECWSAYPDGVQEFVGVLSATFRQLQLSFTQKVGEFFLMNPTMQMRRQDYNNSGYVTLVGLTEIPATTGGPEWPQTLPFKK